MKVGASACTCVSIWVRRLFSISAISSSSARPRPSDRITAGAGGTGPVDRGEGVAEVGVGQRRDPPQHPLQAGGGEPQHKERDDRADGVPEDELRPSGGQQRKADEPAVGDEQRQPDTRVAAHRASAIPATAPPAERKSSAGRSDLRPRERQEGEGKADEEPKARRGEQRRRMDRGSRAGSRAGCR